MRIFVQKKNLLIVQNTINPGDQRVVFVVVESLKPKYNRLVLFDGFRFPHGMNIVNNDYFGEEFRMNQVFFLMAEDQDLDNPE